jgi:hypothetical protein
MTPGGTSAGLNSYQKFNLATKFSGIIEAGFINGDNIHDVQKKIGKQLYKIQQDFILNNQQSWRFLKHNIQSTPLARKRLWDN